VAVVSLGSTFTKDGQQVGTGERGERGRGRGGRGRIDTDSGVVKSTVGDVENSRSCSFGVIDRAGFER
jgi:hypothetical protein